MTEWTNPERAGYLPTFISENDPRGAVEQINERYVFGGWNDFKGFELVNYGGQYGLKYPEDPVMKEVARTRLRNETVVLFVYDWVAVIQDDGQFRVARID